MLLLGFLRKLLDPRGPVGEVASPSAVYKERLGLPISSPHTIRAALTAPGDVARALAPARFVPAAEARPPKDRVQQISAFIEEVWSPVYDTAAGSTDLGAILLAAKTLLGWRVEQRARAAYCDCTSAHFERRADGTFTDRACGRARAPRSFEDFQQVLQSMQFAPADDLYNVYLETVPGDDPVIVDGALVYTADGQVLRGGTQIQHGRREYREKTKNYAVWDKGFLAKRHAGLAEEASRPLRNVQRALEATAGASLPMRRAVGINFRRDRRSGV